MAAPPTNPGTMTPESKAALGSSLGLNGSPSPTEGSGTVSNNNLSSVDVGAVESANSAAMSEDHAYQQQVHDIILASPAGSTATEGYHLDQQSAAINPDGGVLSVGAVPARPPQEHTDSPD